jgi:hypothetical protein
MMKQNKKRDDRLAEGEGKKEANGSNDKVNIFLRFVAKSKDDDGSGGRTHLLRRQTTGEQKEECKSGPVDAQVI